MKSFIRKIKKVKEKDLNKKKVKEVILNKIAQEKEGK
jgi:hypothetical protein